MKVGLFLIGFLVSSGVFALSEPSSKTSFANTLQYAGKSSSIRAVGLRKKFVFKVYAFGLYAHSRATKKNLFTAKSGLGIEMKLLRDVDGKAITEAINTSVKSRLASNEYPLLSKLKGMFPGEVAKGSNIKFIWTGQGLAVLKNNRKSGSIRSHNFASAFFDIYLGGKPIVPAAKKQFMTTLK